MSTSLLPLTSRLRKKFLSAPALADIADAHEILAPASTLEHRPIIQLPDEAERIVQFDKPFSRDEFIRYSSSGQITHPATIARRYKRATIADGVVYANNSFEPLVPSSGRMTFAGEPENLQNRMLATNWVVEKYFGHWLVDGLSLELLADNLGRGALGVLRKPWKDEAVYREYVGLAIRRTAIARVDDLWTVDDRPMNQGRVNRMSELRRRIRANLPRHGSTAPVFIRRDGGEQRVLLNQDQLADALARRGFTILSPEAGTPGSVAAAVANAPLVVSVEGSALCHAVMAMPDNSAILAIQPPRRVTCMQKINAECAGLRMAHTVADDRGEGFELSEDRLMRICDLVDRS